MNRSHVIEALRAADWSNTPIGNKALIQAAIEHLEAQPSSAFRPARVISYRPGMGEVTVYTAGGVPGYMNIGDTVYVSDRAPVEQPIAALARVAELETALAPFAAVADAYDDSEDGDHEPYTDMGCDDRLRLTLGQHRAARTALSGAPFKAQHSAGYAEARQCANCRHIGINDAGADGNCPECGGFYELEAQANVPSQAQHSVPEDHMIVPREVFQMLRDASFKWSHASRGLRKTADDLLAAAPGKEVGHE
ncbi:TPA: hypothetical protein ACVADE_001384 [Pseudomonas aeruginosa]|uniref:hypothetical protein n=1 Tax=Pseudomonas aeruginosa TaxID=287 RepID=UPI00376EAC44